MVRASRSAIATILVTIAFVARTGMDGPEMAADLATTWLGVKERIWVYAYQLWLAVFAVALLRRHLPAGAGRDRRKRLPTSAAGETW